MTDAYRQILEERNRRIIDAVIQKTAHICPGSVALIGVGGSFCSGDIYENSDLDLMIVANDERAQGVSECFILDGVGFDLYCTPWERLENMAEYADPYVIKLLDVDLVYCADERHRQRYFSLREKLRHILSAPLSLQDFKKAEGFLHRAQSAYVELVTSSKRGDCRYAAALMLNQLEFTLYMLNKAYVRRGVKRIPEELRAMKLLPRGFIALYEQLIGADDTASCKESAKRLITCVTAYMRSFKAAAFAGDKRVAKAEDLRGTYEEIYSNWRNKMYHSVQRADPYLSLMSAAACQSLYNELFEEYDVPRVELMQNIYASDLTGSARAFDAAMEQYLFLYQKHRLPVKRYESIEAFEADYLHDGGDRA